MTESTQPRTTVHVSGGGLEAWRVPASGTEPDERMVDWVNTCPVDWDGDDSGVTIGDVLAAPGDWVVEYRGQWFVVHQRDRALLTVLVDSLMEAGDTGDTE